MALDLTGQRFGRLVATKQAPHSEKGATRWWCDCDCGVTCAAPLKTLRAGHKRSCGCLDKEVHSETARKRLTTHGQSGTPLYKRWQTMIMRCHNPNVKEYRNYGARGIAVCDRWRESFKAFHDDLGDPPFPEATLERKQNDNGYEPGNVVWATRAQQGLNTRTNRILEWNGQAKPLNQWARELGVKRELLKDRLRLGWPIEDVMNVHVWRSKPGQAYRE